MERYFSTVKPYFDPRARTAGVALAVVFFALIFFLDSLTGNEIHLSVFYLLPVCLIAWHVSVGWGLVSAGVASAAWYEAEILGGFHYSHSSIALWNLSIRTIFYAMAAILVVRLRKANGKLSEMAQQLERRVDERTDELKNQAVRLRQLAVELTEVEQGERKLLAQRLHNRMQQLLVAANIRLALLERTASGQDREELRATHEFIDKAIQESRELTAELHPPMLYESGLAAGLRYLAGKVENEHKVKMHLSLDSNVKPGSELLKIILYECAEELLLNMVKHSGAKEGFLSLNPSSEGTVRLTLRDEGCGFDAHAVNPGDGGRFGLFSIRERIHALGGTFKIESAPKKGTQFEITLQDKNEESSRQWTGQDRRKTTQSPAAI